MDKKNQKRTPRQFVRPYQKSPPNSEVTPQRTPNRTQAKTAKRKLHQGGGENEQLLSPSTTPEEKSTKRRRRNSSNSCVNSPSALLKPALTERQQLALLLQMTDPTKKQQQGQSPGVVEGSSPKDTPGRSKIHKRNERGETPLHLACIKGDTVAVLSLLEQGAEIDASDNAGWTPLHEACNHGHSGVVSVLIGKGANVNVAGMEGDTPLHDAVINDHKEVVELLLSNGADPKVTNSHQQTPLDICREESISMLLKKSILSNKEESSEREDVFAEVSTPKGREPPTDFLQTLTPPPLPRPSSFIKELARKAETPPPSLSSLSARLKTMTRIQGRQVKVDSRGSFYSDLSSSESDTDNTEQGRGETPTALKGTPTALKGTPTALKETPTALKETPTALKETPTALKETPTRIMETPTRLKETPTTIKGTPTTTKETPTTIEGTPTRLSSVPNKADKSTSDEISGQRHLNETRLSPMKISKFMTNETANDVRQPSPPASDGSCTEQQMMSPLKSPLEVNSSSSSSEAASKDETPMEVGVANNTQPTSIEVNGTNEIQPIPMKVGVVNQIKPVVPVEVDVTNETNSTPLKTTGSSLIVRYGLNLLDKNYQQEEKVMKVTTETISKVVITSPIDKLPLSFNPFKSPTLPMTSNEKDKPSSGYRISVKTKELSPVLPSPPSELPAPPPSLGTTTSPRGSIDSNRSSPTTPSFPVSPRVTCSVSVMSGKPKRVASIDEDIAPNLPGVTLQRESNAIDDNSDDSDSVSTVVSFPTSLPIVFGSLPSSSLGSRNNSPKETSRSTSASSLSPTLASSTANLVATPTDPRSLSPMMHENNSSPQENIKEQTKDKNDQEEEIQPPPLKKSRNPSQGAVSTQQHETKKRSSTASPTDEDIRRLPLKRRIARQVFKSNIVNQRRSIPSAPPPIPHNYDSFLVSKHSYRSNSVPSPRLPEDVYPPLIPVQHKLFTEQEQERITLLSTHLNEVDRLVVCFEQELTRAYQKATMGPHSYPPINACAVFIERLNQVNRMPSQDGQKSKSSTLERGSVTSSTSSTHSSINQEQLLNSYVQDVWDKYHRSSEVMASRHKMEVEALWLSQRQQWMEWNKDSTSSSLVLSHVPVAHTGTFPKYVR